MVGNTLQVGTGESLFSGLQPMVLWLMIGLVLTTGTLQARGSWSILPELQPFVLPANQNLSSPMDRLSPVLLLIL